jgi:hypothetical protein
VWAPLSRLALELVNSSMRVREELGKLFPRFLLGTAGATVRYAAKGSASPQARALFLKAHALKAIGRQPEAAAMMEHVMAQWIVCYVCCTCAKCVLCPHFAVVSSVQRFIQSIVQSLCRGLGCVPVAPATSVFL